MFAHFSAARAVAARARRPVCTFAVLVSACLVSAPFAPGPAAGGVLAGTERVKADEQVFLVPEMDDGVFRPDKDPVVTDDGVYRPDTDQVRLWQVANLSKQPAADMNSATSGDPHKRIPNADDLVVHERDDWKHEQLAQIRKLLEEDLKPPRRAYLLRRAAELEIMLGRYDQAIADLEAAIGTGALTGETTAESRYVLGRLYLAKEPPDYEKAIENLKKYIAFFENPDAEAYFFRARALASLKNYDDAVSEIQRAIELSKVPTEGHYRLLLLCHRKLGQHKEEIALLERMTELFPDNEEYAEALRAARRKLKESGG